MIQICIPHAIHMPLSFQRKEKEMNEKEEVKEKKRKMKGTENKKK